jgi:hypothetical protein
MSRRRGKLLALWVFCAALSFGADAVTKSMSHAVVVNHYAHTPAAVLAALAVFLLLLGVGKSPLVAVGSGFMFGGLCGNGGQVLLFGYASDWIPIGDWLTNVADIAGAAGLLCCFAGYLGLPLSRTKAPTGGSGMGSQAR